jgi:hypothetical protein
VGLVEGQNNVSDSMRRGGGMSAAETVAGAKLASKSSQCGLCLVLIIKSAAEYSETTWLQGVTALPRCFHLARMLKNEQPSVGEGILVLARTRSKQQTLEGNNTMQIYLPV